ncbi:MAG: hypothetical protein IPO27_11095 [Bacteroidetes bacterium]|nr:hypothetical protein [Bacteroidota bacterium]
MADNNEQIENIDSMDVQTLLNIATHNNAVSYMAQSALMVAGKAHFDDLLLRPSYLPLVGVITNQFCLWSVLSPPKIILQKSIDSIMFAFRWAIQ